MNNFEKLTAEGKEPTKFELSWGVMSDPISEQMKEQNFNLSERELLILDKLKESINTIIMHNMISDSAARKVLEKCHKKAFKAVESWLESEVLVEQVV